MKRINNFFERSPLWQVYIVGYFLSGTVDAIMFYSLSSIDSIVCLKISAISSLLYGLLFAWMVSAQRKSNIFWDYSREVEGLINAANTQEELQSVFDNQFQELRKKCVGGHQMPEITRLYTIIKTKYQYI